MVARAKNAARPRRAIALVASAMLWAQPVLVAPLSGLAEEEPSDERLREAWSYLLPAEQREVVEWLEAELDYWDTFQLRCLRHARGLLDQDPGLFPEAEPDTWFDPQVHAPKDPIPRKRLAADDRVAREARERFLVDLGPPRSAWRYHWGRRRIERTAELRQPEDLFENALAGYPPWSDLAQAALLRALDDGSQSAVHAAFAHAYTDRSGRVYPGITLYDAWASGKEIEMPDVDNLGIVHDVLDDWQTWKAPIPAGSKRDRLYDRVGEMFVDLHRQRGLCEALARTYLADAPGLAHGYGASLDALHWLWEQAGSQPATLAESLPDPDGWKRFLADAARDAGKRANAEATANRRAALARDQAAVRAELVRILDAVGALERDRRPAPPAPPGER